MGKDHEVVIGSVRIFSINYQEYFDYYCVNGNRF